MAFQPSVVEYFNNRKRSATDELRKVSNPKKVLVLDRSENTDLQQSTIKPSAFVKKIVYTSKELNTLTNKKTKSTVAKKSGPSLSKGKKGAKSDVSQMDIRKTLLNISKKKTEEKNGNTTDEETNGLSKKKPETEQVSAVPFLFKGALSPAKKITDDKHEQDKTPTQPQTPVKTDEASTSSSRKELNLGKIRTMLSRSSRLEEIKTALKRFNEKKEILTKAVDSETPTLDGFENIDLQVPASPLKTPKKLVQAAWPQGKLTPSRLFDTPPPVLQSPSPLKSPIKSPAFQRYQALVTEGRPVLVLPFKYRALAELFRCVDTVASMMHNRRETITLNSLRPGVQEISRKTLTEYHLGQIKTVMPNAFDFTIQKKRAFGSTEKYELVITPLLSDFTKEKDGAGTDKHVMMGPSTLLARRRTLYNLLLDLTKEHHDEFLQALVPPMCIPRARLTRWHPEFAVDDVPDILSASLPQPPNTDKVTSAKDVLEKARDLFVINPRMARALQKVSQNHASVSETPSPPPVTPTLALRGVPAGLLERVRAKQAARALEAMTRSPAQAKEAVRLTRLPEIARILRNLFVAEKKSVLTRDQVLSKLADSYRESLSHGELDDHLKLLELKTPGWLTFCNLRKTDYVKLSRNADMSRIMSRLEALAVENAV